MHQLLKRFALRVATVFIAVSLTVLVAVQPAKADYLIQKAKVDNIQNTSSNGDNFAITVSDGEGLCNDKVIIFPTSGVVNSEAHYRAYLTALSAMNSGARIDVYDYSGSACENGGQISITKPVITLQVAQLQTDQKITEANNSSSSGAISEQFSGANTEFQKADGTVQQGGQGIAEGEASEPDFYGAGQAGGAERNGGRFGYGGAQGNFAGAGQAGAPFFPGSGGAGRNGGRLATEVLRGTLPGLVRRVRRSSQVLVGQDVMAVALATEVLRGTLPGLVRRVRRSSQVLVGQDVMAVALATEVLRGTLPGLVRRVRRSSQVLVGQDVIAVALDTEAQQDNLDRRIKVQKQVNIREMLLLV
jgi:hypothetical protein